MLPEQEKMNRLVAQAMEEGALGLTAAWHAKGPEYPDEVVRMAKVVRRYGVTTASTWEAKVSISWRSWRKHSYRPRVRHSHSCLSQKMRAKSNWGRVRQVIEQIEEARREGLEIYGKPISLHGDADPWRRLFPRWVQDAPLNETISQFKSPTFREKVIKDRVRSIRERAWRLGRGIVAARVDTESLKPFRG